MDINALLQEYMAKEETPMKFKDFLGDVRLENIVVSDFVGLVNGIISRTAMLDRAKLYIGVGNWGKNTAEWIFQANGYKLYNGFIYGRDACLTVGLRINNILFSWDSVNNEITCYDHSQENSTIWDYSNHEHKWIKAY